jgi:hypothetical protein
LDGVILLRHALRADIPLINLFTVDGDLAGRRKAEANLTALDAEYRDGDFIADLHRLVHTSTQNQHGAFRVPSA